ncbi:uncharacterized protein A1O5_04021 [Cladophialophora psammophila CBS 110553]|uniref:beta-mannosidase n=1 Tax=Cladophialophora psammophila CBS 110553 TaxID=1182543 RepID=W9WY74_9EURO|nr:uncharacterized protein A1O5_04021 [Cladophialophora psammophila CBS 110553]EXJ72873.1 hypothetical protein A1O5_04021 [Cladophialophora psammophila CBS 110553]
MAAAYTTLLLSSGRRYKAVPSSTSPLKSSRQLSRPVPTEIHLDLLANGVIPDPFIGKNEEAVQWVREQSWIYELQFEVPEDAIGKPNRRAVLLFEGLDTFATVKLNDQTSSNPTILFVNHLRECRASWGRGSPQVSEARLATRKAQYHYGWDWGPKFMTRRPWKPIYLDLYSVQLEVVVMVDGAASRANVQLGREGVVQQSRTVNVEQHIVRANFRLHDPDLWWPFALGEANLYETRVSLYQSQDSQSMLVDEMSKTFGIQKAELIQRPLPGQEDSGFFFKINNVPIFAAGSYWIPADSFLSRVSTEKYTDRVKLPRDSDQVMIRVWDGAFQHTRKCEIASRWKRSKTENYIIPLLRQLESDSSETDPGKILESTFPTRYFYEHTLPAICKALSPAISYWPGSPFGGAMENLQQVRDIHQWHVWHLEMFPYQDFPKLAGRFVSEFGMQTLPGLDTVEDFFPPEYSVLENGDVSEDKFLKWHNKMEDGGDRIAHYGNANIKFETGSN